MFEVLYTSLFESYLNKTCWRGIGGGRGQLMDEQGGSFFNVYYQDRKVSFGGIRTRSLRGKQTCTETTVQKGVT